MIRVLCYISNFREIADYLKSKKIDQICVLGQKNSYLKLLFVYMKLHGFKTGIISNWEILKSVYHSEREYANTFFLILDKKYQEWIKRINPDGCANNYFVFYV